MAGVYRSSINLIRWRGLVPNPLNAGRVETFMGAGAIADVQAGVAREASVQTVKTGVDATNNTLASNMPYLPQIDGRVLTILNTGAQQSTLAATKTVVDGIASTGAQQSTLAATKTVVDGIASTGAKESSVTVVYNQLTAPGVIVQPNSYVITKTVQRGDMAMNNGEPLGHSVIAAVTMAKARFGWGGCLNNGAAYKQWIENPTLLTGERNASAGNENLRWEVEEKP